MDASPLFDYMRERHTIYRNRQALMPKNLWTKDPIFKEFRFCNVYRELDRTTIWLRENVREKVPVDQILLATVVFRWFNRMTTGEAIFQQTRTDTNPPGATAWEEFVGSGDTSAIRSSILKYCGKGPHVTGSYIIKTPDGYNKLDGVLWCIKQFYTLKKSRPGSISEYNWRDVTKIHTYGSDTDQEGLTLEAVWEWLKQFPYLGDFMAYEIVTDLRHTPLLDKAPDIMTWANPGPGAMRGLNRLLGRDLKFKQPKVKFIEEMRTLLFLSEDPELWPRAWPALEMRDIEHSLCELDKYTRVKNGEGRPRQVFR